MKRFLAFLCRIGFHYDTGFAMTEDGALWVRCAWCGDSRRETEQM